MTPREYERLLARFTDLFKEAMDATKERFPIGSEVFHLTRKETVTIAAYTDDPRWIGVNAGRPSLTIAHILSLKPPPRFTAEQLSTAGKRLFEHLGGVNQARGAFRIVGVGDDELVVYCPSKSAMRVVPKTWEGIPVDTALMGQVFPAAAGRDGEDR